MWFCTKLPAAASLICAMRCPKLLDFLARSKNNAKSEAPCKTTRAATRKVEAGSPCRVEQSRQKSQAVTKRAKRLPVRSHARGNVARFPFRTPESTNPHEKKSARCAPRQPLPPREGQGALEGPLERPGPAGRLWVWGWRARGSTRLLQTPALAGKDRLRLVRANRGADRRKRAGGTRKKAICPKKRLAAAC